jgi:hypothetical protein
MNSNQRSEVNNQSNNGGNELDMNSARAGTADRNNIDPATQRGSGTLGSEGNQQSGQQSAQQSGQQSGQPGMHSGSQQSGGQQSGMPGTDRQTGSSGGTYQEPGAKPSGAHKPGYQNADQRGGSMQSSDRSGSQTGASEQRAGTEPQRQSNDAAGGLPKSPGGQHMSASEKMNDDTGLSNTANREPSELDRADRQDLQSNVGRRSDGTPD